MGRWKKEKKKKKRENGCFDSQRKKSIFDKTLNNWSVKNKGKAISFFFFVVMGKWSEWKCRFSSSFSLFFLSDPFCFHYLLSIFFLLFFGRKNREKYISQILEEGFPFSYSESAAVLTQLSDFKMRRICGFFFLNTRYRHNLYFSERLPLLIFA